MGVCKKHGKILRSDNGEERKKGWDRGTKDSITIKRKGS